MVAQIVMGAACFLHTLQNDRIIALLHGDKALNTRDLPFKRQLIPILPDKLLPHHDTQRQHDGKADHTFTSLTNGASYTFKVRAVNSVGAGTEASATATPAAAATVPGVPQSFTATPGDTQVVLSWTAPASNGGSAITKYQYSYGATASYAASWNDIPSSGAATTTYTVTSLTNGTGYTFEVRAVNTVGNGATSGTQTATPTAAATAAPTITGPTTMTLTAGYAATSTGVYTITGTAPVTVSKTTATHWVKDNIDFVASRELISGATSTTFAPDTAITRATFLMALGKLSGADVSGYKTSSFTDILSLRFITDVCKNKRPPLLSYSLRLSA